MLKFLACSRGVNYVNLINIFVYRNHVDYYSLSSTFLSECRPSIQVYRHWIYEVIIRIRNESPQYAFFNLYM